MKSSHRIAADSPNAPKTITSNGVKQHTAEKTVPTKPIFNKDEFFKAIDPLHNQ